MPSKISRRPAKRVKTSVVGKRNLAHELLESIQQMKQGKTRVVHSAVTEARRMTGLSQTQFAALLGVSVRTLQGWEQGRKRPSGAARTLLAIASTNPKAILNVASGAGVAKAPRETKAAQPA